MKKSTGSILGLYNKTTMLVRQDNNAYELKVTFPTQICALQIYKNQMTKKFSENTLVFMVIISYQKGVVLRFKTGERSLKNFLS